MEERATAIEVISMAVPATPVTPEPPVTLSTHDSAGRLARWLAAGGLLAALLAVAVIGIGYAVGGADAVEDTWVGWTGVGAIYAALAASALAFLTGGTLTVRRGTARGLWLPLLVFPGLALLLILGELFWWE